MPRLCIDLTDLADWSGPFTGIQHTVFNLASRYAARSDVVFAVFDDVRRRFAATSFSSVADHARDTGAGARGQAILVAQRILDGLPAGLRDRLVGQISRRLRRLLERALCLRKDGEPLVLTNDDMVLVPGASWHDASVLPELTRLKRQHGFRLVALVHDLMPVFHPEFYPAPFPAQYRQHMRELFRQADLLVANSRHTQAEIRRFCGREDLATPRCEVFRLGDSRASATPVAPDLPLAPGGFILSVGLERRKNAALLCQVVRLAAQATLPLPPLVLAGRPSWIKDDHAALMRLCSEDPEVKTRVHVLTDVSDGHLAWLYQNCRFTMFPSLCEGWGLPVGESLAQGKVCLASSASSIPEVGGDLADYASPHDPGAFLELVRRYLEPRRLAEREAVIRERYRPFGWDQAFAAFDGILKRFTTEGRA
jgi:glycosyltransferase involved in cell wall biosynthesis